jgi:hypothetical protein
VIRVHFNWHGAKFCPNTCLHYGSLQSVITLEPEFVILVTSGSHSVYYTVSASVHFIYGETSMKVLFCEKLYIRLSKILNGTRLAQ